MAESDSDTTLANEEEKYAKTWRRFRIHSFLRKILSLGALIYVGLIFSGSEPNSNWLFVTIFASLLMFRYFKDLCPRCNHNFFIKGNAGNPFRKTCIYCGLPKYAPFNPESQLSDWDKAKLG